MEDILYKMIFKRKSFHLFRNTGNEIISPFELTIIEKEFKNFQPLIDSIKVEIKIVPTIETTCKRDGEYCILLYSEVKDFYLQNIGYLGEQLELYLTSLNIGTLWFGIGKVQEQKYHDLDFVIMIAIKKVPVNCFRKNMYKSKRKELSEIWSGEEYLEIANIIRFAPSACNTQPWIVESSRKELTIYRYKKPGKRGIMPTNKVDYYNKIDIGIFLLFLDVCLKHYNLKYHREIYIDNNVVDYDKILISKYFMD